MHIQLNIFSTTPTVYVRQWVLEAIEVLVPMLVMPSTQDSKTSMTNNCPFHVNDGQEGESLSDFSNHSNFISI